MSYRFDHLQGVTESMKSATANLFAFLVVIATLHSNLATETNAQVSPNAGMMRYADVSKDKIVFVYADDLWLVDRKGGVATPLASPKGAERNPRFSPDGKTIAFMGNYEGGTDLYTIPASGGIAQRITFHPASEVLCDWTPDGKSLLYSSNGFAGLRRVSQLFTISAKEPLPSKLPVPYGTNGSISPDGKTLAYTPHSRDTRTWKRYRGGMASDVWLYNLDNNTSKQITDFEGTDSLPMWFGDKVYYISDGGSEHRLNIWSYAAKTGEREQITKFNEFDCKWPSIGPGAKGKGEIVVQNGSKLYLIALDTKKSTEVKITIPGDRPKLRTQKVDASDFINGGDISPTGKRVAIEARGDIWTLPAKNGPPRNLTRTNGIAERSPSWSPDGRWIAYFSDKTGEYELYATQSDGRGDTLQLTKDGKHFRDDIIWSPDSKWLTFTDNSGALHLCNIEKKEIKQVDKDPWAQNLDVSWSHDSAWITYAKAADNPSGNSSIWVYKVTDGTKKKLTNGFFSDSSPTFDAKGDYIFFSSSRAFNSPKYEDIGTTFIYSDTEVLIAMPLRKDVKHPMLPKSDEESWKEEKSDDEKKDSDAKSDDKSEKKSDKDQSLNEKKSDKDAETKDDKKDDKIDDKKDADKESKKEKEPLKIDFEGIEHRSFQIPVGQGSFGGLAVNDKNQLIFASVPSRGGGASPAIKIIDLDDDSKKAKTVVEGAANFGISGDRKKLVVLSRGKFYIVSASASQKLDKPVSTSGMTVRINPREEWKQMFVDAWRMERELFYDPTMHGVDWQKIREHYEPMVDDCVSRRDLGFLIGEMIAELNVGHAYYRSGDVENGPSSNVGMLGCTFEKENDAYKIGAIFEGAAWDVDARNPLRAAGIKSGEFLLAINDLPLSADESPYESFQGLAGKTVILTISEDAKIDDKDRRVPIKTLSGDSNLRFRSWIEMNRKKVEEKTKGKVGYIYVVNTGIPGQNDLVRQFYGQLGKEALIIDDRWNGGGQIPTRFIELLNRPVTNYWARRHGRDWIWSPDSHQGPKCMLTNGLAGSGGDMFPALFKQAKLGKLIGTRTWGGLVGITGGPRLLDGASVTAPSFAYYEKDGTWGIEGHGVDPDIEVIDDPAKMMNNADPQLDAAIAEMLKELETNGFKPPKRPDYPDRSKFGIKAEDK